MSNKKFAVFPWVGTRQLFTLHYALLQRNIKNRLLWITNVYLEVVFDGVAEELEAIIRDIMRSDLDMNDLPLPDKVQVRGKYNEFIPLNLLRKQFIEDYLDFEGLKEAMM
jgi:ATP-dependent Lhr-like helicase